MSFIYVPSTAAPSLQIGTPVDTTGIASTTFIGIPLTSKLVYINFQNVGVAGSESVFIQLGNSTTIETSGYFYNRALITGLTASSASLTGNQWAYNLNADSSYGTIVLSLENSTTNTWNMFFSVGRTVANLYLAAGSKSLTAALSQIKIFVNSGNNWTSGQINIAYM